MHRYRKLIDFTLLAAILIGLFISSSTPYYKQDIRGTLSKVVDKNGLAEQMADWSVDYAGKEISVEEKGVAGFIEFFLRKATHFSVFAVLALVFYRVLRYRLSFAVALPWSALLSLLVAVLDEWHQTFTPDRTGMVGDVLLDASGSVSMLLVVTIVHLYSRKTMS
ncbi:VanZ family protein [Brevibacillus centrosporus]|uniref:VanZ family protein n=1 Tax=Brevibacillus centrosporus TaxID=54910 RepID=UPI000F0A2941|nr:VanZ family protein [Brevibacillus centrosporus]MEC2128095.1 VanZ family protein [Brevibacillus centrosporus]RNB63063.1 VanZ family protein [Brevibacillus centrosporus]GED34683.1 membrane protein [Brevibacillus centrosporus]